MKIPNFENFKFVDSNGEFTAEWRETLSSLFTQLQKNLSDEGFIVPQQSTSIINDLSTTESIGALLYDQDIDALKVNINGIFQTIVSGKSLKDSNENIVMKFESEVQFLHNSTGTNTVAMGANSPATNTAVPYTWVKVLAADDTECYIPIWK